MSFVVDPDQVTAAAQRLAAVGASIARLAPPCHPDAGRSTLEVAACLDALRAALAAAASSVTDLGLVTAQAARDYRLTDQTVLPGTGVFGP